MNEVHDHYNFSTDLEEGQEPINLGDLLTIGSKEFVFDGFPNEDEGDYSIIQVSTPAKGNRKAKFFELETVELEGFIPPAADEAPKNRAEKVAPKEEEEAPEQEADLGDNDYSQLIAEGHQFNSAKELVEFVCSLEENEELKNSEIQKKYGMPNSVTISQVRKAMKEGGTQAPKAKAKTATPAQGHKTETKEEVPAFDVEGLVNTSVLDNAQKGREELANALLDATDFIEVLDGQFSCLTAKAKKMVEKWTKLADSNLPE